MKHKIIDTLQLWGVIVLLILAFIYMTGLPFAIRWEC